MRESIPLTPEPADLSKALDELEAILTSRGLSKSLRGELRLMAEEAATNVLKYASAQNIELTLELDEREARLELRDDPLEAPPPDLDSPLDERPVGGLGIHLLKELTDRIRYRREAGFNVLSLAKRLG